MRRLLLIAAALGLMSVGAAWGQDSGVRGSKYYPLAIGNEWTYVVTADGAGQKVITSKIIKTEEFEGTKCAVLEVTAEGKASGTEYLAGSDEGMRRYAYNKIVVKPSVLFLKLPANKGDTWEQTCEIAGQSLDLKFEVMATDQKIRLLAGDYEALVIKVDIGVKGAVQMQKLIIYYAAGIGQVKTELDAGGKRITIELKEFKAGK